MNKEESLEFARTYTADLLTFFGVNVEVTAALEDEVIELCIPWFVPVDKPASV